MRAPAGDFLHFPPFLLACLAAATLALSTAACSPADNALGTRQALLDGLLPLHLEEHLERADVVSAEPLPEVLEPLDWRFDQPQPEWRPAEPWNPTMSPPLLERAGDALRVTLTDGTRNPDGVPAAGIYLPLPAWSRYEWGEVVILARSAGTVNTIGLRFNLRPGRGSEADFPNPFADGAGNEPVSSDGEIQSYRFPIPRSPDVIRELGLWFFSDDTPASIDILSVSLEPRHGAVEESAYGVRPVGIRPTVYVHTPARIAYPVRVPEQGRLDVGLGVLRHEQPVTFRVSVQPAGGAPQEVLHEAHAVPDHWLDRTVDLSQFAGREVTLVLQADSDAPGTVALWGAPTLDGGPGNSPVTGRGAGALAAVANGGKSPRDPGARAGRAGARLTSAVAGLPPRRMFAIGDLSEIGSSVWWVRVAPGGERYVLSADPSDSGEVWIFDRRDGSLKRLDLPVGYAEFPSWSPDGEHIAFGAWDDSGLRYMWTTPADEHDAARRVSVTDAWGAIYSPDGHWIAYGDCSCEPEAHGLLVVPARGGEARRLTERPAFPLAWSPDGQWIYYHLEGESPLWFGRVPAAGGPEEHLFSAFCCGHQDVGISPDTRYLALGVNVPTSTGQRFTRLVVWSLEKREVLVDERLPAGVTAYGWNEEGRILAVREEPRATVRTLSTAGGPPATIGSAAGQDQAPVWSPDRRRVAFQTWAGDRFVPAVMNADGSGRRIYREAPTLRTNATPLSWSPDGRSLGYRTPLRGFLPLAVPDENRNGSQNAVVALDVASGGAKALSTWNIDVPLFWQHGSEAVVFAGAGGGVWESAVEDGGYRQLRRLPPGRHVPITEDDWIVLAEGELKRVSPDGTGQSLLTGVHASLFGVSVDGRSYAAVVADDEGQPTEGLRVGIAGANPLEVALPGAAAGPLLWHPDGSRFFTRVRFPDTGRHAIVVVPATGGRAERFTPADEADVTGFNLSPDGASLVYAVRLPPAQTLIEIDLSDRLP